MPIFIEDAGVAAREGTVLIPVRSAMQLPPAVVFSKKLLRFQ
jgi:hypothetical protein